MVFVGNSVLVLAKRCGPSAVLAPLVSLATATYEGYHLSNLTFPLYCVETSDGLAGCLKCRHGKATRHHRSEVASSGPRVQFSDTTRVQLRGFLTMYAMSSTITRSLQSLLYHHLHLSPYNDQVSHHIVTFVNHLVALELSKKSPRSHQRDRGWLLSIVRSCTNKSACVEHPSSRYFRVSVPAHV